MRIKVCGRHFHNEVDQKLIREACHFYGGLLFTSNEEQEISKGVVVQIQNVKGLKARYDCDGFTHYTDGHINPSRFTVEIDAHLNKRGTLSTLAHEFAHVRQFATGIKQWSLEGGKVRWYGQLVNPNDYDYYDLPWEIDAYGREVGLFRRFIDEEDKKKEDKKKVDIAFDDILKRL